ncbi:MAG: gamma-glutamyltransferase [Planctomycetes bacterium]|nr:gamma-glutamyltransferase [Planctomycetota bacterium]
MQSSRTQTLSWPLLAWFCLAFGPGGAVAQGSDDAIIRYADLAHPQLGASGMVASQNYHASDAGAEILAAGGNAVDAAIAVGFSLAVSLPRAGNLGGGGFMLIHDANSGESIAIDYRERAPLRATRDMYLDEDGNVVQARSRYSHLAAGVPGTVAGLYMAYEKFGSLPWRRLLEPAIRQAREGVVMTYDLAELLKSRQGRMCSNEATCRYFYRKDGSPYEPGDLFVQRDLAETLERIARHGPDGFYKGKTAALIAAEMKKGGGLVDEESLLAYEPVARDPIIGNYRGYEILTMPPPSSGGVHIIQMLNVLEHFPVRELGAGGADNVHLLAEAARLAYADRSKYLGDPDFYDVPVAWLTSKEYGKELAATIDMNRARPSSEVAPGVAPAPESPDTTHYSVIDAHGMIVSTTTTLNFSFGSGIAVPGAGFLLNNEMDDFAAKPGVPNAYGLLGGEANSIASGKRPLSSMTPTIVLDDGEPWFATGSPGGSRIITSVLQMVVNMIDHQMNLAEATAAPRMHHQWLPDVLQLESGFSPDTVRVLRERGHHVEEAQSSMGSLQSVGFHGGVYRGASDPRRPNAASRAPDRAPDRR